MSDVSSVNLAKLRAHIKEGAIHVMLHDSIGKVSSGAPRYTSQLVHLIGHLGGPAVTAWAVQGDDASAGVLRTREETTPNPVLVSSINNYVLTGLSPEERVPPAAGHLWKFGEEDYTQGSADQLMTMSIQVRSGVSAGINPTSNDNRRVALRPLFLQPEDTGVPNQDFEWRQSSTGGGKGSLLAELNFNTDCRTHYYNGGDPDNDAPTNPYRESIDDSGKITWFNALKPDLIASTHITANDTFVFRLGATAPATLPDSGNLPFVGGLSYRVGDIGGSDEWVGGSVISAFGDNSFQLNNFADNTEPTPEVTKDFKRESLRNWLDVITINDSMRSMPVIFWVCCATESGYVESIKTAIQNIKSNVDWACAQVGWQTPQLAAVHWHYSPVRDLATNDAYRDGMRQAAQENRGISFVDGMGLRNDVPLDGNAPAQAEMSSFTNFSFGDVSNVDLSGGNLVGNDNLHQNDENSAAFYMWNVANRIKTTRSQGLGNILKNL